MTTAKRLLVLLGLVSGMVLAPAASALADSIVEVKPCPSGYEGVIVTVDGHSASVCQNILP